MLFHFNTTANHMQFTIAIATKTKLISTEIFCHQSLLKSKKRQQDIGKCLIKEHLQRIPPKTNREGSNITEKGIQKILKQLQT